MTQFSTVKPEVVIVGAGVIGCSVAYFLAAYHGIKSLVIERDGIASQASGGAAGELGAVGRHEFPKSLTRFLLDGIALHDQLAPRLYQEGKIDYLLSDIPMFRPAFTNQEQLDLQAQMEWQLKLGMNVEWLDNQAATRIEPWLSEDVLGVAYSVERQLEAYPFAICLAQAAESHGVEIRTGEVTGILSEGSRAIGVRVGREELYASKAVIFANGPWTQEAGEWMGCSIPVIPLRGQIVHVDTPPGTEPPNHAIFHETGYVLPKKGGDILIGTTQEDVGFDRNPTREAQDAIMEAVMRLAPPVGDAPIRDLTACLRPYNDDQIPILGAIPGWESLFIATGHGYKGVTLALVTGKAMAELIADGSSGLSLRDFDPSLRLVAR